MGRTFAIAAWLRRYPALRGAIGIGAAIALSYATWPAVFGTSNPSWWVTVLTFACSSLVAAVLSRLDNRPWRASPATYIVVLLPVVAALRESYWWLLVVPVALLVPALLVAESMPLLDERPRAKRRPSTV